MAFTVYQWKFFLDEIKNEIETIDPAQVLEVKYSHMISDTKSFVQPILYFAGLGMDSSMKNFIEKKLGDDKNNKWKERLTGSEKNLYAQILKEDRFIVLLD